MTDGNGNKPKQRTHGNSQPSTHGIDRPTIHSLKICEQEASPWGAGSSTTSRHCNSGETKSTLIKGRTGGMQYFL